MTILPLSVNKISQNHYNPERKLSTGVKVLENL